MKNYKKHIVLLAALVGVLVGCGNTEKTVSITDLERYRNL